MRECADCTAIEEAASAMTKALEYSQRRFVNDGYVSYNHDEAIRLAQVAAQLSEAGPGDHAHIKSYWSKHDDPAMMEVDPGAFYLIKEHVSDRASE